MRRFLLALVALATLAAASPPTTERAERILVLKAERKLQLFQGDKVIREYQVALGGEPVGKKTRQGDHKTPEGNYTISGRNPRSQFHRSLRISYPSAADRAAARRAGVSPGGDIFVHGLPNGQGWIGKGHLAADWTDGCIAVTNEEIEEIWRLVPNGTPIEIRP